MKNKSDRGGGKGLANAEPKWIIRSGLVSEFGNSLAICSGDQNGAAFFIGGESEGAMTARPRKDPEMKRRSSLTIPPLLTIRRNGLTTLEVIDDPRTGKILAVMLDGQKMVPGKRPPATRKRIPRRKTKTQ